MDHQKEIKALRSVLERQIAITKKLYNLPTYRHAENVGADFFNYVQKRHYFVILAIFDHLGRLLIVRDFSKTYGWELVGGSVDSDHGNIIDITHDVATRKLGAQIFDVQPIAFVHNQFKHHHDSFSHVGLAFTARILGEVSASEEIEWGFFKQLPSRMFTTNFAVAELAMNTMASKAYAAAAHEVKSAPALLRHKLMHRFIIKPLFSRFASIPIQTRILASFPSHAQTFLDTSCGDDELVRKLCQQFDLSLVVCNDIVPGHRHSVKKYLSSLSPNTQWLFTNHDINGLPFHATFDVVVSKNTLHHLSTDQEIIAFLEKIRQLGKTIIIVDIEDPHSTTWRSWLWNKYYIYFLGDQGDHFLDRIRFRKIIEMVFNGDYCHFGIIPTIKGDYLLAVIGRV